MSGAGAIRLDDLDDCEAWLPAAEIKFVFTEPGPFDARVTWAKLPNALILDVTEDLARIAYLALPPDSVFVSFAKGRGKEIIWNGRHIPFGQFLYHAPGERFHQRVPAVSHWGVVAVASEFLASFGSAFAGEGLVPPRTTQVLRPDLKLSTHLLRFHSRIARLSKTRPASLGSHELARSIEHELLLALIPCLMDASGQSPATVPGQAVMRRFEDLISDPQNWPVSMSELQAKLRVSTEDLRSYCSGFLGVSAGRYILLRRLRLLRKRLLQTGSAPGDISELAKEFGFADLARFSEDYYDAFGESPVESQMRPRRFGA